MPREEELRLEKVAQEPRSRWLQLRGRIAKYNPRTLAVALKNQIGIKVTSMPAPAVGGPVIQFYLFDAMLRDPSHGAVVGEGVDRQTILDAINATIGACERRINIEWGHLINPFYRIKARFIFVLRLPVNLIGLAGFNIAESLKSTVGENSSTFYGLQY